MTKKFDGVGILRCFASQIHPDQTYEVLLEKAKLALKPGSCGKAVIGVKVSTPISTKNKQLLSNACASPNFFSLFSKC